MILYLLLVGTAFICTAVSAVKNKATQRIYTGCIKANQVALTFDDGIGNYTEELLDLLAFYQVKASFFILGETLDEDRFQFEEHKNLLIRMIQDGHVVGTHSFDHPDFTKISSEEITRQLLTTDAAIKKVLGVRPRFLRPPFGHLNKKVLKHLTSLGYLVVTWNKDTNDWRHQGSQEAITDFVKYEIGRPSVKSEGVIILQHDTLKTSIKLQGNIIRMLRKKGYKFVSLQECLGHKPYRI